MKRFKPSQAQLQALEEVVSFMGNCGHPKYQVVSSLLHELKKLSESKKEINEKLPENLDYIYVEFMDKSERRIDGCIIDIDDSNRQILQDLLNTDEQ